MRFLILCFFFVLTNVVQAQKSLFPIIENGQYGFIDSTGKVVIAPRFKAVGTFSEGLAAARKGGYYGYIDTKGDWKIPPQYDYATEFAEGLAIVFKNGKPFYIDHKGKIPFVIGKATEIIPFKNGFALIKVGKKIGVINKKGQRIVPLNIYSSNGKRVDVKDEDKKEEILEGEKKIQQVLKQLDESTEIGDDGASKEKPFLRLEKDNKQMVYLDSLDRIVWQEKPTAYQLDTLDIDYIVQCNFYAPSNFYNFGGSSENGPNDITPEMNFTSNQFTIEIRTTDTLHLEGKWMGYKVFVANNSADTFRFSTIDRQLYMNMQATDEQGIWRDIEYFPYSWCGNSSYAIQELKPKEYWSFQTPLYKGSNATRLRLKLKVEHKEDNKSYELYSNEIKASINPAQFWRKKNYSANKIMWLNND